MAVESGSQRVRDIVNKKLASAEIERCARSAQEGGLEGLKLYGMVGVPGEREEGGCPRGCGKGVEVEMEEAYEHLHVHPSLCMHAWHGGGCIGSTRPLSPCCPPCRRGRDH